MMKPIRYTKLTSIRIDEEKYTELEELAVVRETSTASLIRLAISHYLAAARQNKF